MSSREKELIMALAMHSNNQSNATSTKYNTISRAEFFKLFPVDLKKNHRFLLDVFEEAYHNKDTETIEYGLMLIGFLETPLRTYAPIFKKLLKENWHQLHEMLLDLLVSMKDVENVEAIYQVVLYAGESFNVADYETIAVKAIWGLSAIGSKEAWERIKTISENTSSDYVKGEYEKVKNAFTLKPL
ncbi:hypothetical protein EXU57_15790 [Segetibacter sp. 3557_3]|uniref:hypothetical protein n=1 Tax=Segetibacter sp. 3557_3 TaxID=2547429 RepID=UPI001058DEA5|nr:hypothetical protein [Segetibacter sp. 3557_3]TDH23954.1 hypothetical protein EXU57_15790 [Segetibacter sp. 3557_3]